MKIVEYFTAPGREHWLEEIGRCEWDGGTFLYSLLKEGTFFDAVGEGSRLLLLTDGDDLVSFLTYARMDDIQPTDLTPWVGFVYTYPAYRGRRCAGILLDEAARLAKEEGVSALYVSTDHTGLYEKYGFEYFTQLRDIHGGLSRIYVRRIG